MRAYDVIARKRDGHELEQAEIEYMVQGFTQGSVPDYQMSAWAMAIFLRGMSARETGDMTMAMVNSGDQIDLSSINGIKVDKHSTGGVGDTTTLVLAPLVASEGAPVAKMSGRGLGHTGGTLDKFEAIPGFRVELNREEFIENVNKVRAAVVGQTGNLVPADKKLYALRDVTATVNCIPLIASSIMSKKLAAGADAIVLDVKTGSGAFMKTLEDSFSLAKAMVDIGTHVGKATNAIVTDMDQPLGLAIGNALEVKEAIATLKGEGPEDLLELCLALGSEMLVLAEVSRDSSEARKKLLRSIKSGAALEKFREIISAQGGDSRVVDSPDLLPAANYVIPVLAEQGGFIEHIEAEELGMCATALGAGRETKESKVDLAVGLLLAKKRGDKVAAGDILAYIHANAPEKIKPAVMAVKAAYTISVKEPVLQPLIHGKVTSDGINRYI
jgi:pyrimidine-nucleoside phosphorylase